MIRLNIDHLAKRYHHDFRIREIQNSKDVHGAVTVDPELSYGGYVDDDGVSWFVFSSVKNDKPDRYKYRLVFHDRDDTYGERYMRDDSELYQFFDSLQYRDLNYKADGLDW